MRTRWSSLPVILLGYLIDVHPSVAQRRISDRDVEALCERRALSANDLVVGRWVHYWLRFGAIPAKSIRSDPFQNNLQVFSTETYNSVSRGSAGGLCFIEDFYRH